MATVLYMGVAPQDPNIDLPPGVSAEILDAGMNKSVEDLKNAGYQVVHFLPPIMQGIDELEKELQRNKYDLVLVGVSVSITCLKREGADTRTNEAKHQDRA
jgi:predicted secreted protein